MLITNPVGYHLHWRLKEVKCFIRPHGKMSSEYETGNQICQLEIEEFSMGRMMHEGCSLLRSVPFIYEGSSKRCWKVKLKYKFILVKKSKSMHNFCIIVIFHKLFEDPPIHKELRRFVCYLNYQNTHLKICEHLSPWIWGKKEVYTQKENTNLRVF